MGRIAADLEGGVKHWKITEVTEGGEFTTKERR
jgi:hypothetical protein